jgi:hypothetical protein
MAGPKKMSKPRRMAGSVTGGGTRPKANPRLAGSVYGAPKRSASKSPGARAEMRNGGKPARRPRVAKPAGGGIKNTVNRINSNLNKVIPTRNISNRTIPGALNNKATQAGGVLNYATGRKKP